MEETYSKMPLISIALSLNQACSEGLRRALRKEEEFRVVGEARSLGRIEDILSQQKVDGVIIEVRGLQELLGVGGLIQKEKDLQVIILGDLDQEAVLEYLRSGAKA